MDSSTDLSDTDFVKKCNYTGKLGDTPEQIISDYADWAPKYEQDYNDHGYMGHIHIANKMSQIFASDARATLRILDVAAGTGIVGNKLRETGFVHLDALDPTRAMLDEAKKRNIYENYFYEFMSDRPLNIKENTYDALVGSALFGHEHIPVEAVREMARLVKPGGHIVVCFKSWIVEDPVEYKAYTHLMPFLNQLETEGVLRIVSREHYPQFYVGKEAELLHFQVL